MTRIEESARHLMAQIQELRDIARLQSERPLDFEVAPLDLAQLVQRVVGAYDQLDDDHAIQLEVAPEAMQVMGDAMRLERVLHNLLSNAIKYSPEGGR